MAKNLFLGPALQAQWTQIWYMQFQGKYMIHNRDNCEKLHFGPDLGTLGPNSGRQFFFLKNLALSVTRYHGREN